MKNSQDLNQAQKSDSQCCFSKTTRLPRYGYTIEERKKVIDQDSAYKVLTPALRRKCTKAVRDEDTVVLTKQVIVCPCCGKETPAY